jgi:hypothetical protein
VLRFISVLTLIGALGVNDLAQSANNGEDSRIEFSGFSRLVAGYLDEEHASFEGYEDSIGFGERSLLAVQIDAHLNERFSLTTQLLAHSSDSRDSGVEWLYLSYKPTKSTLIKAGKLRTPFFAYSDILDVGYAYPWVSPQQQVYASYVFDSFEGASINYQFPTPYFVLEFEAYHGSFKDKVAVGEDFEDDTEIDAEIENFTGLAILARSDKLTVRASVYDVDSIITYPVVIQFAEILDSLGYARSAQSLSGTGQAKISQIGLFYDDFDYFFKSEIIRFQSKLLPVPNVLSYYVSGGYISYPFTYHATFASNQSSYPDPVVEIPLGLDPQIDFLRGEYISVFNNLPVDSLESLTLGVRWDFAPNMALKFDVMHLRGEEGERSFFSINDSNQFDSSANLYEIAWEWVF